MNDYKANWATSACKHSSIIKDKNFYVLVSCFISVRLTGSLHVFKEHIAHYAHRQRRTDVPDRQQLRDSKVNSLKNLSLLYLS